VTLPTVFEVELSTLAKEDLRRIYSYGAEQFGSEKAEQYFYAFFSMFDLIAQNPFLYQSIDHIRPGYRRCRCGSDHIYYRIHDHKVQIMAIIGAQDLQYWLG
jgi:toxin ParE1/3/4